MRGGLTRLITRSPADAEQYPPGVLGAGLEMADILLARNFPKPLLLCGQRYCFFDRRGLAEAHKDLQILYGAVGKCDHLGLFIGEHTHGFHPDAQQAVTQFFCRHARLPAPAPLEAGGASIEAFAAKPVAALAVCPAEPQLGALSLPGATPVHELLYTRACAMRLARPPLTPAGLVLKLRELLVLPEATLGAAPEYRIATSSGIEAGLLPLAGGSLQMTQYVVQTQAPMIETFVHCPAPHRATLDVALRGSATARVHCVDVAAVDELRDASTVAWLTGSSHPAAAAAASQHHQADGSTQPNPLYLVEPRGLGESWPDGDAVVNPSARQHRMGQGRFKSYGFDYMMHGHSLMFGESYLGGRVWDLMRVVQLLIEEGAEGGLILSGRGQGAIVALFAATLLAFDPATSEFLRAVELREYPRSCEEWLMAPVMEWPAANCLRGMLQHFDISDVCAALATRVPVRLAEPLDALMEPAEPLGPLAAKL